MCAWETPRTWSSGELVTAALMNSQLKGNLDILKTAINDSGQLEFTDATELTIASGAITVTQNYHKIDTQSDAGTDDLDTITAGTNVAAGFVLHVRPESGARTVVLKNGTSGSDNLNIGADVTLSEEYHTYSLVYDGTNWRPFTSFSESQTFADLSPLTTRGDVLVSSSGTVTGARLAIGSANQVLTSDGTDAAWAAAASGGKVLQVQSMYYTAQVSATSSTFATTNVLDTITLDDSNNKCLVIVTIGGVQKVGATSCQLRVRRAISGGATTTIPGNGNFESQAGWSASTVTADIGGCSICIFDNPETTAEITYTVEFNNGQDTGTTYVMSGNGRGSITLIEIEV
jgi:hypothetical protein